jgi:carbon storage regulator
MSTSTTSIENCCGGEPQRIGERIVIGDRITVTVLEIRGGQVRLGVEAPKEVAVWRKEVLAKKEMVSA